MRLQGAGLAIGRRSPGAAGRCRLILIVKRRSGRISTSQRALRRLSIAVRNEMSEHEETSLRPADADQLKQPRLADRIEGLRGMAWAYALLLHTGYTASSASKRFSSTSAPRVESNNSKLIYQYLRGDRAPTPGPRGRYKFDLVAAVNSHHTGHHATRWLYHPLWIIFNEDIDCHRLEKFLDEDALAPDFARYIFREEIPADAAETLDFSNAPEPFKFEGYILLCAMIRAANLSGHYTQSRRPVHFSLLEYLTPHAARIEPVFGMIQKPFLQMIRDFHFPKK
jgi:hypothetical protein